MSGHITQCFFALLRSDSERPPPLLAHRSSRWFILTTICTAVFTDIFLYGIIVPVIPFALTKRARIAEDDVQHWVSVLLAVYGAALLASAPICGYLADKSTSRRLPLLIGLLALAGATLMLCFGNNIGVLVAGRILQGISAAIVWTVGLALLVDTVGQKEVGQVLGYVSISMSVAILVAPLLGGVVYDRSGYYGVYYMSFALIIFDIMLRITMVEKKVARQWDKGSEDVRAPGPTVGEKPSSARPRQDSWLPHPDSVLHMTLSEKKIDKKWTVEDGPRPEAIPPPEEISQILGSKKSSPLSNSDTIIEESEPPSRSNSLARLEARPQSPLTSSPGKARKRPPVVILLSSRRLLSALYCALVQSALMTAWDAVLPLRVNVIFGWGSLGAGLIFLPLVLPSFLAPLVGAFSDKYGARLPTFVGFVLSMPFLILLRIVDHGGRQQVVILCVLLALLGTALTIVMTPLLAEVTYILDEKEKHHPGLFGEKGAYAQAYGLFNCAFAGGMLVGPLWAGFVVEKTGWGTMCLTLGVLALVSSTPALLFINGWIGKRKRGFANEDQCET
ncbi:MAG: hypothetical protein LQ343_003877 [Gyalolechia ehrenbergii]|nr:MAG: hypothetical protein LQ343_003877 [Gyalolechia ehrenbergii]